MRRLGALAPLLLGLGSCEVAPPAQPAAELVIVNANVLTLAVDRPTASGLAVRAGRIVALGSRAELAGHIGSETRLVDLAGQTVLPGFIDAHAHFFGEGQRLMRLDLVGTRSKREVLERAVQAAAELPAGSWLSGRGWDQNDWAEQDFPTAADLDAVISDRPVYLRRVDGHAAWLNSLALELVGIDERTRAPEGGRILRDAAGRPSGVLIDTAIDLVRRVVPEPTSQELREAARRAAAECFAAGLTSLHDAGLERAEIAALEELLEASEALPRLYVMATPGPALDDLIESGPRIGEFGDRLTIRAVKFYVDGALGSRGAALLADYSDEPGHRGLVITSPEALVAGFERAAQAGIQPAVHAIGDAGNQSVLDAYERALSASQRAALRPRIEHAQVLALSDIERFASLGVIASMQPTHATSDMPWAQDRVGLERIQGAYAWRRLLSAGARLAFGSDAPVESVRPLWGVYAAVTRSDHAGQPQGGWRPEESLTVEEALGLFTREAAYAGFEEDLKGTIAVGKLADLVVVPKDPTKVAPQELLDLEIVATILGGQVVYGELP